MTKTILITGATDGIGLQAAKLLASDGHTLLLHGRNQQKLYHVASLIKTAFPAAICHTYLADLSKLKEVEQFTDTILDKHNEIDVIINNAGIFKTPSTITEDKLDIRFAVNNVAPYLIVKKLLPILGRDGRIINLSSAAQASGNFNDLTGKRQDLTDMEAYSESKLGITMWTCAIAKELAQHNKSAISLNPGSLLASKMVKEAFGIPGKDIMIGANILLALATKEKIDGKKFQEYNGCYYDNDLGLFSLPNKDAQDSEKCQKMVLLIESILENSLGRQD